MAFEMCHYMLNSFFSSLFQNKAAKQLTGSSFTAAGEKAFECGDYKRAVEVFSEKIQSNPENVHYLTRRCEALMKLKDFKAAKLDATDIIEIDKKCKKGYILAIKCSLALDKADEAEFYYALLQIIDSDEEIPELTAFRKLESEIDEKFETKHYQECLGAVEELQKMTHVQLDRMRLRIAKCCFHLEDFNEAKLILSEIVKDEPNNIEAAFIYANCLYHEGNLSKSIIEYESILKRHEDRLVFEQKEKVKKLLETISKGVNLYNRGKFRKAARMFSKALDDEKENKIVAATVYNNRGMALTKLRYYKSAIEDFNESYKLNSENENVHEKRAYPLYKNRRYSECIIDCEEAIKHGASEYFKKLKKKAEKKLFKKTKKLSSRYENFSQPSDDNDTCSSDDSKLNSVVDRYLESVQKKSDDSWKQSQEI